MIKRIKTTNNKESGRTIQTFEMTRIIEISHNEDVSDEDVRNIVGRYEARTFLGGVLGGGYTLSVLPLA